MEEEATDGETQRRDRLPAEYLYFTIGDVAEMLDMSARSVGVLMKKERWPHSKYGTRILFDHSDLDAIRAMHRVDVALKARPTHVGTERSRRLAHSYNVRNGLVEQRYTGPR